MSIFNVANFPMNLPMVDNDGMLTTQWQSVFRSLYNQVGNNFNEQGLNIPTVDSVDVVLNPDNGTQIYSAAENLPKIYVNGEWKTISTT